MTPTEQQDLNRQLFQRLRALGLYEKFESIKEELRIRYKAEGREQPNLCAIRDALAQFPAAVSADWSFPKTAGPSAPPAPDVAAIRKASEAAREKLFAAAKPCLNLPE